MTRVIVLGGGVGAERRVSLDSSHAVANALRASSRFEVEHREILALTASDIAGLPMGVIFPVLHGPWGEGGPLQRLLEDQTRSFVGAPSTGAALAMDKARSLDLAEDLGIPIPGHVVVDALGEAPPLDLPVVAKPVAEGSSVGIHICRSIHDWTLARTEIARNSAAHGPWLVERFIAGRELTVGVLDAEPLPIIEIVPAEGFYDYQAKYERSDTAYIASPDLPEGLAQSLADHSQRIFRSLDLRHLARADFILDAQGTARFLEINTMPGFTAHSLLPMAASASGMTMADLCVRLVDLAVRDAPQPMMTR